MKIKTMGILIAAVVVIGLGVKYSKNASTPAGDTANGKVSRSDRYLVFATRGDPEYLDPGLISDNESSNIANAISEGLVEYDPKGGDPVPAIATRWELSPDQRTYTFHMRKDAKWSDGHPVTAQDFIYSWERVLNPATGSKYAFALSNYIKNGEAYNKGELTDASQLGFKALDEYTVQLEIKDPTPYFLHLMCYPVYRPVPKWAIEAHGARWTDAGNMVTTGPFMLERRVTQKEIVVKKDPNYWDAANVQLAGIKFMPVEQVETAFKMYEAGEADIDWYLPEMKLPTFVGRPDYVMTPQLATYFYWINTQRKPFTDVRVRRALAMAVDRKILTEKYLHGAQLPSANIVPSYLNGYPAPKGPVFDPAQASALLDEAGFKDRSTFPTIAIHYNTLESHKLIAQVIQQMWKEHLGINVQLLNEEWKTYLKTLNAEQYDIARHGWIGDYPDPNTFLEIFIGGSSQNHSGWANAEFDALMTQAMQTTDKKERWQLLADAEVIFAQDVPAIPIYAYTKSYLIRPYVKGYYPNLQDIHPYKGVYLVDDADGAVAGQ